MDMCRNVCRSVLHVLTPRWTCRRNAYPCVLLRSHNCETLFAAFHAVIAIGLILSLAVNTDLTKRS